jgi:hypothetical protein
VEALFLELAGQFRPAVAELEIKRGRGFAKEDWLVITLRPRNQDSAPIHVDVVTDEVVFGVGDYGCRIDLEISGRIDAQEALQQTRQLAMAVITGGYSEIVKDIPIAGKYVEGILNLGQKTLRLHCGVALGNLLPGQSKVISYQPYDKPAAWSPAGR